MTEKALAANFERPSHEDWLALVEKALKGGDFEKRLVTKTRDDIRIDPLYTRADAATELQNAAPGAAPYTRGTTATPDGLGWEIMGSVTAPKPADANRAALAELEGGGNGLTLRIAAPEQNGITATSASDFATVLSGVFLDFAPVVLDAGVSAAPAADHFITALENLGADAAKVRGNLGQAPIETWATVGTVGQPVEGAVEDAIARTKKSRATFPNLRTLKVSGRVAHEAGGSEAQELAFLAAALVAYLRAFDSDGVAASDALPVIGFELAADPDLFLTAAKFRAARKLIWRIADAAGATDAAQSMHLTAVSSERVMAKRDPWTNMLRTTAATFAAAVGGADAILVLPYTWPLGQPDAFAQRIARNQQIVAQEESSLGRVVDPAGGAWYIEDLTKDLAQAAWSAFQQIENEGGLVAALRSGKPQERIAETAVIRARDIATGRQALTGVSTFPLLGDDGVTVDAWPQTARVEETDLDTPLTPVRFAEPFEALRDAADAREAKVGSKPQVFLASMGRVADHNVRTTWTKNFFAAGGVETLISEGYATAQDAAAAFKASGAKVACICSSDPVYADLAADTAQALKDAGTHTVYLAGRPGELEAELRAAGVATFLAAGQDALTVLSDIHETLAAA